MSIAPSVALVRARVLETWQKSRSEDPQVFAIRAAGGWSGPPALDIEGEPFDVVACRSALEVRERLAMADGSSRRLIVITTVTDEELGEDVLARFAKRRVFGVDAWDAVARSFQAVRVDPGLRRQSWMAGALLDAAPPNGYPAVPSGLLDRDTAWTAFLTHRLGLKDGRPDAVALLSWTLDPLASRRFASLEHEAQEATCVRFRETAGLVGEAIATTVAAGHAQSAVAIGVVLRVLDAVSADDSHMRLREAAVRLEPFTGGRAVAAHIAEQWGAAADLALRESSDTRIVSEVITQADGLMQQIGVIDLAYRSDWSVRGFEQRLARFAGAITEGFSAESDRAAAATSTLSVVEGHRQANQYPEQLARARMAVRLLRWLDSRSSQPRDSVLSFADAAIHYQQELALVDAARVALRGGDATLILSTAYGALMSRVAEVRESHNRAFGEALAAWIRTGSTAGNLLPVEEVIDRVVVPLARHAPVLLLVIDGMSMGVWRELSEDLFRGGWVLLNPESGPLSPGLATIPSVTQFSRTSLLSGHLVSGTSADEKRAFEAHPALFSASRRSHPPRLFHKGDLSDESGRLLSAEVRREISCVDRRVVAAVINAVDDHLMKADQVRPRWTLEYVPVLAALLQEARAVGRVVVFASDHGHLLDDETVLARSDYGDRWRADDSAPSDGEIVLTGPRVMVPGGRLIAPWSERTRYGMRKNGYHGGVTPQEMIVPVAVLSDGVAIPGWVEAAPQYPSWWDEPVAPLAPVLQPVTPPEIPVRARPDRHAPLFEALEPPAPVARVVNWIDLLLQSSVYAAQKQRAGRVAPSDDQLRRLLSTLDERGGKLTRAAMAHRLDLPLVRVSPVIAAARRVLNVEGYAVLRFDEASETLELNRDLLISQFELSLLGKTQ